MRLHIDQARCQGHDRCVQVIGDLVELDDLGFAHVAWSDDVPGDRLDDARLAVRNCPEDAISLGTTGQALDGGGR
jgi:ferredoxin